MHRRDDKKNKRSDVLIFYRTGRCKNVKIEKDVDCTGSDAVYFTVMFVEQNCDMPSVRRVALQTNLTLCDQSLAGSNTKLLNQLAARPRASISKIKSMSQPQADYYNCIMNTCFFNEHNVCVNLDSARIQQN